MPATTATLTPCPEVDRDASYTPGTAAGGAAPSDRHTGAKSPLRLLLVSGAAVVFSPSWSMGAADSNSGDTGGGESACQTGGACEPHDDGDTDVCRADDECDCPSGSQQGGAGEPPTGPTHIAPVSWDTGEKWETAQDLYVRLAGKDFTFFRQYSSAPNLIENGAYDSDRVPSTFYGSSRPWIPLNAMPQVGAGWSMGNLRGMVFRQSWQCTIPVPCDPNDPGEGTDSNVQYLSAQGWLLRAARKPRKIEVLNSASALGVTAGPGNQTLTLVGEGIQGYLPIVCKGCSNNAVVPDGIITGTIAYSEPGIWTQQFALVNGFGWLSRDEDVDGNLRVYWDDPGDADVLPDVIYLNGEGETDAAAWVRLYWEEIDSRPTLVRAEVHRPTGTSTSSMTQYVEYFHLVDVGGALRVKHHLEDDGNPLTEEWVVVKDPTAPLNDLAPSADLGTQGDLVQVVRRIAVEPGDSASEWRTIISQYRYHDGEVVRADQGESFDIRLDVEGLVHQLKSSFEPQQVEFMAQHRSADSTPDDATIIGVAIELLAVADDGVAFVESSTSVKVMEGATKILGYSNAIANPLDLKPTDSPVVSQILQAAGCGCGGGGAVSAVVFDYERINWTTTYSNSSHNGVSTHKREQAIASFGAWPSPSTAYRTHCFDLLELQRGGTEYPYLWKRALVEGDVAATQLGRAWVTSYKHDATTHAKNETRTASSSSGYTPAVAPVGGGLGTAPASSTASATGLVVSYAYDGEHVGEKRVGTYGEIDPPTSAGLVEKTEFVSDGNDNHRRLAKKQWLYRVDGSGSADNQELVEYAYGFDTTDPGSGKLDWRGTTVERELLAENGPTSAATVTIWEFFDDRGQLIVGLDAEGIATRYEYDASTGMVTRITRNYDPDTVGSIPEIRLPSGAPDEPGDPFASLNANSDGTLVTQFEHDLMGRLVGMTRPGGVESYTAREMGEDDTRPGILYYTELMLPHELTAATPRLFDGPGRRVWRDAAYKVTRSESFEVDDAASAYPPTGLFSSVLSATLSRSIATHDLSGAVTEQSGWWDVSDPARNYTTTFEYDEYGRAVETTDGTGTVTQKVYDVQDRAIEVKVGTTGSSPITVARYYFDDDPGTSPDHNGTGNGNLTHVEMLDGVNTRTTRVYFDNRDRRIGLVAPDAPFSVTQYDDQDRPVASAVYPEIGTVPTLAQMATLSATLPADAGSGLANAARSWHTQTFYSQRGLVYKERTAIDATGVTSGEYLESHYWYDDGGNELASWAPNSPGTVRVYDAHDRVISEALTDRLGDTHNLGTADRFTEATGLTGDRVLEQTLYRYTAAGVPDLVTRKLRAHNAAGTGAMSDAETVTSFVGSVYDDALRPVATIDFGTGKSASSTVSEFRTGAGTAPTLGNYDDLATELIPATDVLFSWTVYNTRGLVGETSTMQEGTTAAGLRKTRFAYDDLGRAIATIENATDDGSGDPTVSIAWNDTEQRYTVSGQLFAALDEDRVTSFAYNAAGNVVRRVAHMPDSSNNETIQETLYDYGTVVSGLGGPLDSLISSNRLLHKVHYPDEATGAAATGATYTVEYAYNRLGELLGTKDQNGTTRVLDRDLQGRVEADRVETAGSYSVAGVTRFVDDAVLRLEYGYDALGRLTGAASYDDDTAGVVLNDVHFAYTPLWRVATVAQQHDGAVGGSSPVLEYKYANADPAVSADNYSRLDQVVYPTDAGTTGKTLKYNYTGTDALIGRPTSIGLHQLHGLTTPDFRNLVEYDRLGMGMTARVGLPHAGGASSHAVLDYTKAHDGTDGTVGASIGNYYGYDRFGRVVRHAWVPADLTTKTGGAGAYGSRPPIVEVGHSYDRSSDRLSAADLRPGAKLPFRDRAYSYDGLNRLVNEARSPAPSGTTYIEQHLARAWELDMLDMLGNWGRYLADIEEDGDASDAAAVGSNQVRVHNAANEIEDPNPSAQYDAANQNASGTITSRYYRFAYDDAGNMADERSGTAIPIPPTVMAGEVMTYDAWNRLVATEHQPSTGSAVDISEHSYNALGWRVSKRMDSSKGAYDGVDQERVFLYDASWRMIEERVDTDLDDVVDAVSQQFWGLRYIDDAVGKRVNRDLEDDWVGNAAATTWYQITDSQFSVVAVLDSSGDVYERIEYDAYGNARHRFRGDVTGDGVHTIADYNQAVAIPAAFVSIGHADYHVDYDLNLDGTTDASDIAVINSAALTPALPGGWISDPSSLTGPDNSIGYAGYVFNPEREDYTVRFRVYTPELGRWRQRDPIGYRFESASLYEYSSTNSLRYTDPMGLSPLGSLLSPLRHWPEYRDNVNDITDYMILNGNL